MSVFIKVRARVHIRAVEWLASFLMIYVGVYLFTWPNSILRPGLAGFASIAPIEIWICVSILLGLLRIGALILNGHKPDVSAPIRCAVAILGVGIFSSIATAYALAWDERGPPLAMGLFVLFVLADLYSAARSGIDSLYALDGDKRWTGFSR